MKIVRQKPKPLEETIPLLNNNFFLNISVQNSFFKPSGKNRLYNVVKSVLWSHF